MSRDPKRRRGATRLGMRSAATLLALFAWARVSSVAAQVIEPNGLAVPVQSPQSTEITLQDYFDGRMPLEPIDAWREASAEPATFSPRCGFEAELVLSQSSARAGLAWYNVPADPSGAPATIYQIMEETTQTGAIVSSSQIRSDPSYSGGLIGFALTKNGGMPIYYSEASRNATCTACVQPGPWKLMLAYPSRLESTTYYLAWEDWEGANESSWPDDGDFNDKVFRLSGVRCAGGGEPCETGLLGVCAQGLSGCSTSAAAGECMQLEAAGPELCDGLDNDCDGQIDDDKPCGSDGACVNGACVQACGGVEFPCPNGQVCQDGQCVDSACAGVTCPPGQLCHQGSCGAPCEGVVCPLGQICRVGVCKDPCAAVSCKAGSVCRQGACLEGCQCSGCPDGLACDAATGGCVEAGCEGVTCPAGQACSKGACVDACAGARCPRGAQCQAGKCSAAQQALGVTQPIDAPRLFPVDSASAPDAALSMTSAPTSAQPSTRTSAARTAAAPAAIGCTCNMISSQHSTRAYWPAIVGVGLFVWRRPRSRAA